MSKGAINFSNDNEYYTPKALVDFFGKFDYDPATTKEKAAEFGIKNYDTIETDGLRADWSKYRRIWINPPFTIKHKFLEKAVKYQDGRDIFMLVPIEFLTTKRFHQLARGGAHLSAKWSSKVPKRFRETVKISGFWQRDCKITRQVGIRATRIGENI